MSFSFSAAGPKADVIRQLRSHHQYDTQQEAVAVRDFIVGLLEASSDPFITPGTGWDYAYTVTATGHAGHGSAPNLDLRISPHYVPVPVEEPARAEASAESRAIGDYI